MKFKLSVGSRAFWAGLSHSRKMPGLLLWPCWQQRSPYNPILYDMGRMGLLSIAKSHVKFPHKVTEGDQLNSDGVVKDR